MNHTKQPNNQIAPIEINGKKREFPNINELVLHLTKKNTNLFYTKRIKEKNIIWITKIFTRMPTRCANNAAVKNDQYGNVGF